MEGIRMWIFISLKLIISKILDSTARELKFISKFYHKARKLGYLLHCSNNL
jgi:hypothetical protein